MASVDPGKGQPITYRVNALGQRSVKTDKKNLLFAYDTEGHLIGEYDDQGAPIREYVYLEDRPLATVVPGRKGTVVYFVHTDHLGTPKLLTDEAGKVIWEGAYRPFGEASVSGNVEQPLRFPGQYFDAESGLHYNYFRDYEPTTGRYIESDPIGLAGGLNTYGYAFQNPIQYTDPAGLAVPAVACAANPFCRTAVIEACKAIGTGAAIAIGAITPSSPDCRNGDEPEECGDSGDDCKEHYTNCLMSGLGGSVGYGSACQACFDRCRGTGSWPNEVTSAVFGEGIKVSCRYWEVTDGDF